MGALILYMISGGFSAKAPDEITLQKFVQLVEEKKVSALHETLGSGLYSGLYAESNYAAKDLPNRADFTFSASEEEFSRSMSLLVARLEGKDAEAVSSVDYPFTFTVSQPKGESWLMVILPYILLFGMMALFMWFMYRQQGGGKQMSNFDRSHAREYAPGQNPITFKPRRPPSAAAAAQAFAASLVAGFSFSRIISARLKLYLVFVILIQKRSLRASSSRLSMSCSTSCMSRTETLVKFSSSLFISRRAGN